MCKKQDLQPDIFFFLDRQSKTFTRVRLADALTRSFIQSTKTKSTYKKDLQKIAQTTHNCGNLAFHSH